MVEIPGKINTGLHYLFHSNVKISATCTCIGVIETGLFVNMASRVYFGQADGTVEVFERQGDAVRKI